MSLMRGLNRGGALLLVLSLSVNVYLLRNFWPAPESQDEDVFPEREQRQSVKQDLERNPSKREATINPRDVAAIFEAGEYSLALKALELIDPQAADTLKYEWLANCMSWLLEAENSAAADRFIQAGLALYPRDIDFGQLRAEQLIQRGDVLAGIDKLYELMSYSDASLQGEFAARLQVLFKSEVQRLSELKAWQPLVELSERLLWHESQHPPYLMVHARALYHLQQYAMARSSLQPLLQDDYYSARAKELLDQIYLLEQGDERVNLERMGAHHVVAARANGDAALRLMIDTGASYTVIASDVFNAKLQDRAVYLRDAVINTAGGKVNAQLYRLENFQVGAYAVSDMEVIVMPLETAGNSQGLLGMNYLQRFQFEIDQQRDQLVLSPRL